MKYNPKYNMIDVVKASSAEMSGTSRVGYIYTRYDLLEYVFGKPSFENDIPSWDEKVCCEWDLKIELGDRYIPVSIYCWKTPEIPMDTYQWHIGSKEEGVEKYISEYIFQNLFDEEGNLKNSKKPVRIKSWDLDYEKRMDGV